MELNIAKCPKGHFCKESNKDFMKNYFYCKQCSSGYINLEGNMALGMYYQKRFCYSIYPDKNEK